MKNRYTLIAILIGIAPMLFADTNALIEAKLFKDWIIKGESSFCNLAIKNTGTFPIILAENPVDFEVGQLVTRPLPRNISEDKEQEEQYQLMLLEQGDFIKLFPDETHVYEGRKFLFTSLPFSEEIRFTVSVYLGKGAWLDSEPLAVKGVVPDAMEDFATVTNNKQVRQGVFGVASKKLTLVTYKDERWLYSSISDSPYNYPVCPLSLKGKIRIEPYDDMALFKIWDGEKSMIYDFYKSVIVEGADEHNVLGKWTRERKQKAEADNAEVRRKKQEEQ